MSNQAFQCFEWKTDKKKVECILPSTLFVIGPVLENKFRTPRTSFFTQLVLERMNEKERRKKRERWKKNEIWTIFKKLCSSLKTSCLASPLCCFPTFTHASSPFVSLGTCCQKAFSPSFPASLISEKQLTLDL